MARLWAQTTNFESVSIGDQLPVLIKWETAESIKRLNARASPSSESEEVEEQELSLHPTVLVNYVNELLEKGFPLPSITATGSRIEMDPPAPVKPEDTISLSGKVTAKREEDGHRLVECEIVIENQSGERVARAVAVVSFNYEDVAGQDT